MPQLLAIFLLVVLIAAGWNQSFKNHYDSIFSGSDKTQKQEPASPTSNATADQVARIATPTPARKPTPANWLYKPTVMDHPYGKRSTNR